MSKIVVSDFDLGNTALERQMVEAAGIEFAAFGNEDARAPEALIEHLQDADGAITSYGDYTAEVFEALSDPDKIVLVQTAPAVRAALGEEFGMPIGTNVEGKMVAALRRLGFDKVFDTDFGADMTIMEEATEFLGRVKNGGVLPMITSCSPGWIKFCEHYYPEFVGNLSTC